MELFEEKLSSVFMSSRSGSNVLHLDILESMTYFNFLKVSDVYAIAVDINICPFARMLS